MNDDGGFRGRDDASDPYYTVFGVECLQWLGQGERLAPTRAYCMHQSDNEDNEDVDFVHLCCLVRCLGLLPRDPQTDRARTGLLSRIDACRSDCGGFNRSGDGRLSVYDTFLAWMGDGGAPDRMPPANALLDQMLPNGAWPGHPSDHDGAVPPTAAAWVLLAAAGAVAPSVSREYLLGCRTSSGGWVAGCGVETSDLLSTATALHALHAGGIPPDSPEIKRAIEDYVVGLWQDDGGFSSSQTDAVTDVEYTFYGLLALALL